ncbi:MAG: anti-sigma factor [Acidobacteria bacterium]|nr:MAG: anti-sigma factor [Acidobacteriota bacterium]
MPNRSCEHALHTLAAMITDYLEERLSQTDRIRFEQHLSVCPGCVAYVDQMRVTIQAMGSKPPLKVPSSIEDSLLEAFRRWKNLNH